MLIQEWPPDLGFEDLVFSHSPFWVQIHGLPPIHLTLSNAKTIGSLLGEFLEADLTQDGVINYSAFLRVRVNFLVDAPFPTGFHQKRGNGKTYWIMLKYEKLSDICYTCGIMGHISKSCSVKDQLSLDTPSSSAGKYGPWLRELLSLGTPCQNLISLNP